MEQGNRGESEGGRPAIYIQRIVADRKEYAPEDQLRLPSLTRDLEIDYAALSYVVPQKVQYR